MTAVSSRVSPGVRRVTLGAGREAPVTGLLAEPEGGPGAARALVVALHGGGMSSGYFDGQAHPDVSLLSLGARLGYAVLALDRPGYGPYAGLEPDGRDVAEQAGVVAEALAGFAEGALLLLGHSFGGKVALALAADRAPRGLVAVDVSGVGHRLAVPAGRAARGDGFGARQLDWGPTFGLYPPGTFRASRSVVAPMPRREVESVGGWAGGGADVLERVAVPVRFTFAEHEAWWRHGPDDVADLTGRLARSPRVVVDRLPGAGHNVSLGWAARTYHLRVFAFLEECLAAGGPTGREA
ncbi:thioesterase [Streptomyces omiyaensis]|nr:alpha/beta fold hydrolase [Streptomyces omiyaensis]GGY50955.1 thioesterase [Streptomyces omiyaensis]